MTTANFTAHEPDLVQTPIEGPTIVANRVLVRPFKPRRSPWMILAPIVVIAVFAAAIFAILRHEGAIGSPASRSAAQSATLSPPSRTG